MDFGTNTNLGLDKLNEAISNSVHMYAIRLSKATGINFSIQGYSDVKTTNDKNILKGSARVCGLDGALDAIIIGFAPGGGTAYPKSLNSQNNTSIAEVFIPIGTLYNDQFVPQLTSLEARYSGGSKATIGSSNIWYSSIIRAIGDRSSAKFESFPIHFVGDFNYTSRGKPDTVRFDKWDADNISEDYKNWMQFGAFMQFKNSSDQLKTLRDFSRFQTPWTFHYNYRE